VRIVDCAECRYEVGVVKLGADVAKALVKTAPVAQAEVSRSLRLTGEVAFDATAMVEVVPMAAGTVTTVNVRLGQSVQTGEVLAVIHSNDVGEAKAAYLEVLTAAEIARQERDRQRLVSASLAKLLEALAKGPGNSAAAAEPLGEWRGRLVGAAARLDQARTVFGRESELVRKDASSKADLEAAQYEFRAAEADYAALVEEAQLGLQLEQLRADNAARQAEARLVAAEQRLHLFGFDQAAVDRVREMKENGRFADLEVRAPRAGTVTAVAVTAGHFVDAAQSLCTIADLSNLWVWCHLYERDLAALQEHLRQHGKADATVRVAAFVETFPGVVDLVGDEVEEATRTLKVRVQVPAPDGKLRPGMFATVGIELPTGRTATLVPRGAVLSDEGRAFVFQHWQDDLWLRRHVELGEAAGERVEVLRGLEPGAEVVVSGGFMLKSDVLREKMGAGCAD
jgi:RND family efflux transporter MFP subunit